MLPPLRCVWCERLQRRDPAASTILAEDEGALIGFAHVIFDEDQTWGALLDNIHVADRHRRRGVGSDLLAASAAAVTDRRGRSGLYLWVLEQNAAAQAFYEACGARRVEIALATSPRGLPGRLNGSPRKLRYVWEDVSGVRGYTSK